MARIAMLLRITSIHQMVKVKSLLKPVIHSTVSHMLISFVLGYFATTKIIQFVHHIGFKDKPEETRDGEGEHTKEMALPQALLKLTSQQLMAFDGYSAERPIYTALNGKIYDLSIARDQFKPDGPYSLLAGCDANKVLAIACGYMGVSTTDFVGRWEQCLNAEFTVIGTLEERERELEEETDLES